MDLREHKEPLKLPQLNHEKLFTATSAVCYHPVAKTWQEKTDITMQRVYDYGPSVGRPTQFDSK